MAQVAGLTEMDIVIGVAPTSKLSLETELRLIKPALLYGDRVTLYSPATSLVAMAAAMSELSDNERVDLLAQVVPAVSPDRSEETLLVLNTYRQLKRTRRRSREQILLVERMRRQLDVAWDMIRERIEQMVTASGADELAPAIERGLLEIDVLLKGEDDFSPDRILREFLDRVGVRNNDQVLDLRLRNATAQTCQRLFGGHGRGHRGFGSLALGADCP